MSKVYIVHADRGSYSDREEMICGVFSTEEAARAALEKIESVNIVILQHAVVLEDLYSKIVKTKQARKPNKNIDALREKERIDYLEKRNQYVSALNVDSDIKDILTKHQYPSSYMIEAWDYDIGEYDLDEDIMAHIKAVY